MGKGDRQRLTAVCVEKETRKERNAFYVTAVLSADN